MKVTIITITYNSVKTLESTIQSVLTQKYSDLEYIVVDGGSTDGTLEILKKYNDSLFWISEKDEGISDAFNKGIALAKGEIIGIINSDDQLAPDAIEKVVSAFQPQFDIVYGNGLRYYPDGKTKSYYSNSDPNTLYKGMSLFHPGVFVRKCAYEKYGYFSKDYKCVMDRELLLRMLVGGARFSYINEILAIYSMGGMSDKNYYKYTLPEDYRISVINGMNAWEAKIRTIKQIILYKGSILKRKFIK